MFFINVPLAIADLAIAFYRVPTLRYPGARRLDLPGATLAAVGLGGVVLGLLEYSKKGLGDPLIVGSLVLGFVALGAFVVVEGRARETMVPLDLLHSRDFAGANAFTLLFYFALGGTLFFLLFNLIWVQGYSATAARAAIVPAILLVAAATALASALSAALLIEGKKPEEKLVEQSTQALAADTFPGSPKTT